MVKFLPEGDRYSMKYVEFTSQLAVAMGGRVAEEITFGKDNITSGASSDIEQATRMARAMVTRYGYSDKLGTVAYGDNDQEVFLGMSMGRQQTIAESTAQTIDAEVKALVDKGYADARRILTENNEGFRRVAEALLEYETLTGEECKAVMRGEKISRKDGDGNSSAGSAVPTAGRTRPRDEPTGGLEPSPTT
jgi:cell division protease FtsH